MKSSEVDLIVRSIILNAAQKKGQIIHGTRALNPQLPVMLQRKTEDYDILTKNPKKSAQELVDKLKRYTSKDIQIKKAVHKGTYRVSVNGKTVADYTQLKGKPKTKKTLGVKYLDIKTIKKGASRRIKNPSKEFRKEKDLDTLERIKQIERKFDI